MPLNGKAIIGPSTSRYKIVQVDAPNGQAPTAEFILRAMEEFHQEGWRVCGVAPSQRSRVAWAIWIMYERT